MTDADACRWTALLPLNLLPSKKKAALCGQYWVGMRPLAIGKDDAKVVVYQFHILMIYFYFVGN